MGSSYSVSSDLETVISNLGLGVYKNVVVLCGAGISTNAGIPDFRSPSAGLYFKLRKFDLPYPEAVFEGRYFRKDPLPFYSLVREIYPQRLAPTTSHKFLTLLHNKGILRRVFTQNIDALEGLAGLPEDKIVEAHGSFKHSYCTACKKTFTLDWLKREIFNVESNLGVPKCSNCGGVVRPDVVLFGESLPERFWNLSSGDMQHCDLLLVVGTSLAVAPFNGLVTKVGKGVPRIYISKTKPGSAGGTLGWLLGLGANVKFDGPTDFIMLDDCDRVVKRICDKNKWTDELNQLPVQVME